MLCTWLRGRGAATYYTRTWITLPSKVFWEHSPPRTKVCTHTPIFKTQNKLKGSHVHERLKKQRIVANWENAAHTVGVEKWIRRRKVCETCSCVHTTFCTCTQHLCTASNRKKKCGQRACNGRLFRFHVLRISNLLGFFHRAQGNYPLLKRDIIASQDLQ